MSYTRRMQIEFNHCDPAGIVFYPRYFEMINSTVENFFADVLAYPFTRIVLEEGCGVPTVRIETDFRAPSRLGDTLDFTLAVSELGHSSAKLRIVARAAGEIRLRSDVWVVWVSREGRAAAWPETIRAGLAADLDKERQNR